MNKSEIFLLIADASVLIMIIDQLLVMVCNIKTKDHNKGDIGSYVMFLTILVFLYFYNGRVFGFVGEKITTENTTMEWIIVTTAMFVGINLGLAINKYEVKKFHALSNNLNTLKKWEAIARKWLAKILKQQQKIKTGYYEQTNYDVVIMAWIVFILIILIILSLSQ